MGNKVRATESESEKLFVSATQPDKAWVCHTASSPMPFQNNEPTVCFSFPSLFLFPLLQCNTTVVFFFSFSFSVSSVTMQDNCGFLFSSSFYLPSVRMQHNCGFLFFSFSFSLPSVTVQHNTLQVYCQVSRVFRNVPWRQVHSLTRSDQS